MSRSFNLDESELTVSSNVDPYFFANVTAAIQGDNSIDIEEAYFKTLALNNGFTIKGGRFFSGYRLPERDPLAQLGLRRSAAGVPGVLRRPAGAGRRADPLARADGLLHRARSGGRQRPQLPRQRSADSNSLASDALFAHLGGDVGDSTSWRLGVSWLDARSTDRATMTSISSARRSPTRLPARRAPGSSTARSNGRRTVIRPTICSSCKANTCTAPKSGQLAFDVTGRNLAGAYNSSQSGWYVQAVYEFMPALARGLRYDSMQSGTPRIGLVRLGRLAPGGTSHRWRRRRPNARRSWSTGA